MDKQPPMWMCQMNFCTWRSGPLKERTLRPVQFYGLQWSWQWMDQRARRWTFQVIQLHHWTWHNHVLYPLRLEITNMERVCPYKPTHGWVAFVAHDDQPEWVTCYWHLNVSTHRKWSQNKQKGLRVWKNECVSYKAGSLGWRHIIQNTKG